MTSRFDLVVIGAGSGGVRAARVAASLGAKVAICEEARLGGTCVNVGCVPKKLFVYGAHFAYDWQDATAFGWSGTPSFDWPTLVSSKDAGISRLNDIYRRLLVAAGVEIYEARAKVLGPHQVEVGGKVLDTERILVATGSSAQKPDVPGAKHGVTSNALFELERLPKSIVVVGGGYIAVEFAGVFRALGVEVALVHRRDEVLRGFDHDVRAHLQKELENKGVRMHLPCHLTRLEKTDTGVLAHVDDNAHIKTDLLLFATGRTPNTAGLGLEEVGVKLNERGAVVVDEGFQSSVPSIYALGDVIDRLQLTPVAIREGIHLAQALYGDGEHRIDYQNIPTAVFSQPQIGTVGLTEEDARVRFGPIRVYRTTFTPMKLSLGSREERTMMKLVVVDATDRVVGCHMVGSHAGEIVQGLAVAMKAGATKKHFDETVGIHPTAAEEFVTLREPVG